MILTEIVLRAFRTEHATVDSDQLLSSLCCFYAFARLYAKEAYNDRPAPSVILSVAAGTAEA